MACWSRSVPYTVNTTVPDEMVTALTYEPEASAVLTHAAGPFVAVELNVSLPVELNVTELHWSRLMALPAAIGTALNSRPSPSMPAIAGLSSLDRGVNAGQFAL